MPVIPVNLAVEDEVSATVLRRLLLESGREFHVGAIHSGGGFGYLKRTVPGWNQAAQGIPIIVLTDLDDKPCAGQLVRDWLKNVSPHSNLMFRVAVRTVESWLLADRSGVARFLGIRQALIPGDSDSIPKPKEFLISLAHRSPRKSVRQRIVPLRGSTAKQGREYNSALSEFVSNSWNPREAAGNSASLRRAMECLDTFHPVWDS